VQLGVYLIACSGVQLRASGELTWERIDKQAGSVSSSAIGSVLDSVLGSVIESVLIAYLGHQQKTFPSGRNDSVRVDALHQSRQRDRGGGLLRARRQYHASRCISLSDRRFAVSSRSVGLLF